jgi:hypothetical protein
MVPDDPDQVRMLRAGLELPAANEEEEEEIA